MAAEMQKRGRRGGAEMGMAADTFVRVVFVLLLALASAVESASKSTSCLRNGVSSQNVKVCNTSCRVQISSLGGSPAEINEQQTAAGHCQQSCEDALSMGFCYCRKQQCLNHLPCVLACFHAGVFRNISTQPSLGPLRACMRTSVLPSRKLETAMYWLPRNEDMSGFGNSTNIIARFPSPGAYRHIEVEEWTDVDQKMAKVGITSPISFPVSVDLLHENENRDYVPYANGFAYAVVHSPLLIQYVNNTGMNTVLRGDHGPKRLVYYSPDCIKLVNVSHPFGCADDLYSVRTKTDYYTPLKASGHRAGVSSPDPSPSHVADVRGDPQAEVSYRVNLRFSWRFAQFQEKIFYADLFDVCPIHSCWCWESCGVRHSVTWELRIGGSLLLQDIWEREDELSLSKSCLNETVTLEKSINVTGRELFGNGNSSYLPMVSRNAEISAKFKSYYAADTYFGPRRQAESIPFPVMQVDFVAYRPQAPPVPVATSDDTISTEPRTVAAQGNPNSGDGGAVVAVTTVMVILVVVILVGLSAYAYHYRKWRCVGKSNNLETVQKFRALRTSTNTEYVAADEVCPISNGLPKVSRGSVHLQGKLGSGQFGDVYKATVFGLTSKEESNHVAVKVLKGEASPKDQRDFLLEAQHLNSVSHPNVIQLLGVCLDDYPKMILLELMDGGNLLTFLQENRPGAARPAWDDSEYIDIAMDITAGMRYLESKKFVHRDIAARNCLVSFNPTATLLAGKPSSSGRIVKISDFGLTRIVENTQDYYRIMDDKALLPVRWMAPESLQQKVFTGKSDVWSFGILFWEIFTYGQTPYGERTNAFDVYTFVTMGGILEQPQFCPPAMYRMMKSTWSKSPTDRPPFRKLHDHLCTFQNRLRERRTTLLTTLESFASVSGITDVERVRLPRIPGPQRVELPRAEGSVNYSVFDDDSELSDNAFDSSVYPSESDNAFESPVHSPIQGRRAHVNLPAKPSPLVNGNTLTVNMYRPGGRHRVRRKSRSKSASRDDLGDSGAEAAAAGPPLGGAGRHGSSSGRRHGSESGRPSYSSDVFAEDGDTDSLGHLGPPVLVSEYCHRKPLSPIVSASSVPEDARSSRRSRTNSSGSALKPAPTETSL